MSNETHFISPKSDSKSIPMVLSAKLRYIGQCLSRHYRLPVVNNTDIYHHHYDDDDDNDYYYDNDYDDDYICCPRQILCGNFAIRNGS